MKNHLMDEVLKNCSLFNLNRKKSIYIIFGIPKFAQNSKYDWGKNYTFLYRKKHNNLKITKSDRLKSYIEPRCHEKVLSIKPIDYNSKDYRIIVNFNRNSLWLKKAQQKFNKLIEKSLGKIDYLYSSLKNKSYIGNAKEHIGSKYVLAIDISNFFTNIGKEKVKMTLKKYLSLDGDVADFYSKMLTSKANDDKNCEIFNLGQGLPSSPILAYLCNKKFFDYLKELCDSYCYKMTLYVDDLTISSDVKFNQAFINRIFGLFKENGLPINKKKFRNYKSSSSKKITGIYISKNGSRVPYKKIEETYTQLDFLKSSIKNGVSSFDEYLNIYSIYLRFLGNVDFIEQATNKKIIKFRKFLNDFSKYFPLGIGKTDKCNYSIKNISASDKKKLFNGFNKIYSLSNIAKP